jgi:DNA-binding MarR family transcriptional regulator
VAHKWADELLRSIASRQERVVLAVRDAARMAEKQGLTPSRDEIYVASSIRDAWKLKPDQLSKGLKKLRENGFIRFTCSRRGRHTRFVLANSCLQQASADQTLSYNKTPQYT